MFPFTFPNNLAFSLCFRLRSIVRQLQSGHVSAELLQSNLLYAAKVLETVYVDETR